MAPFLKENQQLLDADAWCIGSQTAEQTLENTLQHPERRAQDARKHNRNCFENWRRQKRLSD